MLEILFGPDGVGKSTVAAIKREADPEIVVLHGTNPAKWFKEYPGLMAELGVRNSAADARHIFPRAHLLNRVALALAKHRNVIVDGHCLHKTVITTGQSSRVSGVQGGLSVDRLIDYELAPYFDRLAAHDATSTHVTLDPNFWDMTTAAVELQSRIAERGEFSSWDPYTVEESRIQLERSWRLAESLGRRGMAVSSVMTLPVVAPLPGQHQSA